MNDISILAFNNRGTKIQMTIKIELLLQICKNGIPIMIGQLGLVQLTNRKTGRKHVTNKLADYLMIEY